MRRHMSHITQRLASFSTTIKKKVWTSRFEAVSMKLKGDRLLFEKIMKQTYFVAVTDILYLGNPKSGSRDILNFLC